MSITGKVATLAIALFAASLDATAADRGFYFGALGGLAKYDFEDPSVAPFATSPTIGFAPPSLPPFISVGPINSFPVFMPSRQWRSEDDDRSAAWGIVAGYRIMRYAAVEANYLDLGKLKENQMITAFPILTPVRYFDRDLKTAGPVVSALGILPITDAWSAYLRAGVFFAKMELRSSLTGTSDIAVDSDTDSFVWGLGTQYDFGAHWSARLDLQRFEGVGEVWETGRADVDAVTVGVLFRL